MKIGSNVVIAAGAVVNAIYFLEAWWGGVPARYIGSFDELVKKRRTDLYPDQIGFTGHDVSKDLSEWMWRNFQNNEGRKVIKKSE